MRSVLVAMAAAVALGCGFAASASADPFTLGPPVTVTGPSPFAPGCGGPGEAGPSSVLYENGEVEPSVAVNPTNPNNIVGFWQQDRWSDGGAHGLLAGFTRDGGLNWIAQRAQVHQLRRRHRRRGRVRARVGPLGVVRPHRDAARDLDLVRQQHAAQRGPGQPLDRRRRTPGAIRRSCGSTTRGRSATTSTTRRRSPPTRPTRAYVYAVWDRLISPSNSSSARAYERSVSFHGPTWFARSTDDGATWEPARPIFDPKAQNQTIANQIVVLPDGTVVDGFTLLNGHKNGHGTRGGSVAILRSQDKGQTWDSKPTIVNSLQTVGVVDPDPNAPRPDPDRRARARSGPATSSPTSPWTGRTGRMYAVWQDSRFSGGSHDDIAFSRSTDGGNTWSDPVKVNQTPNDAAAFTAAVHVRDDGTVAVTYYDFRNDQNGDATLDTDHWMVHSHDGGRTWDPSEARLTPNSFDMRTAPFAEGYFVGDYEGLDNAGNAFTPLFVIANNGNASNPTDALFRTAG